MRHLISLKDWSAEQMLAALDLADEIKRDPSRYENAMRRRTMLMFFEKPSLRTRVSFETAMSQMGGHAIYYDTSTSPIGAGKESLHDTIKTVSRYVDIIMARLFEHEKAEEMARCASVPVINALTNYEHPCQIMADLMTAREKKGRLKGLKLAYLGDSHNNVTHSLLFGCARLGVHISVGCPEGKTYSPLPEVVRTAGKLAERSGASVTVTHDAAAAARDADIVYTDSWMSYHIPPHELKARVEAFTPYQVNAALMALAKPDAIFMNCLPALRGYEQTAEVIDGPQSVVFDEAENRLHVQKAIILFLLGRA